MKVIKLNQVKSIEQKRKELINTAASYGFLDYRTLKVSQELDVLINESLKKNQVNYTKS